MAATPQYMTLVFVKVAGPEKGKKIFVNTYLSDVAAAKVRFSDAGGKATTTSNDFWDAPSDSPVVLDEAILNATTVDTLYLQPIVNGGSINNIWSNATLLASLNNRPRQLIGLNAGSKLQLNQLA